MRIKLGLIIFVLFMFATPIGAQTVIELPPNTPPPVGQWAKRSWLVPTWTNDCNNAGASTAIWNVEICGSYPPAKHQRMFYHAPTKSMWVAGGDHGVSMVHPGEYAGTGSEIVSVNNLTGKWKIIRPFCVPGEPQPNRPDNVGWAHDSKRDRAIMTPGYYFHLGSGCGAIEGMWGGFLYDVAMKKYLGPNPPDLPAPSDGWGGDNQAAFGFYVQATDEYCRLRNMPRLECLNLGSKTWRFHGLSIGKKWNPVPNRAQPAVDQREQVVYWLDLFGEGSGVPGDPILGPPMLAKTMLANGATTRMPLPAKWKAVEGPGDDVFLAFDPINRLVLIPNSFDMGGSPLLGLGFYAVDTGQWRWESVPSEVMGSAWGFDEQVGALIGIGKRHPPYATFLYRPSASGAQVPVPPPTPVPMPVPPPSSMPPVGYLDSVSAR